MSELYTKDNQSPSTNSRGAFLWLEFPGHWHTSEKGQKMNTVNVVRKIGHTNISIFAFEENRRGNSEAEQKFSNLLTNFLMEQNRDMTLDSFKQHIDDGIYESTEFALFLIHSE